jgi:hypothetical protein
VKTNACRLASLLATAALALAVPVVGAGPARAATTTPVQCQTVGRATEGSAASLLGLLGIVIQDPTAVVGTQCTSVPNGDPRVNFCATQVTNGGLVTFGSPPEDHTCP